MIKKTLISASVLTAIFLGGCDNTAKLPESKAKTEGST